MMGYSSLRCQQEFALAPRQVWPGRGVPSGQAPGDTSQAEGVLGTFPREGVWRRGHEGFRL